MKIIYLKPASGYATSLRSDTLWGQLCWGIRHLWGEAELKAFLNACNKGEPPFVVSSTFPYKHPYDIEAGRYADKPLPFFPNPLPFPSDAQGLRIEVAMENARLRKEYKKKFAFVNLDDFKEILNDQLDVNKLCQRLLDIWKEEEELGEEARRSGKPKKERKPGQAEINWTAPRPDDFSMTHNTIDRLRGGTLNLPGDDGNPTGQLFHSPENYWTDHYADPHKDPNTGIFFLADGSDTSKLEPVLSLFRHWGIGADRTTGKGFFDFSIDEIDLPQPADANAMLNLSLFRPKPEELTKLDDAAKRGNTCFHYRIELREGFVGYHDALLRKQAHRYFTEGSVFPLLPHSRHLGGLTEQTKFDPPKPPSHRVFDNGFGFMLHIKWKEKQ